MERLTYFKDGYWRINFSGVQYQADFVDRLAAYEDTGLPPERCAEFARADAEGRYIVMRDAEQEGVARLRELAEADKDGRVVVLPCKSTDKLYVVGKKQIVVCDIAETYLNDNGTIEYLVNFECAEDCTGCPFDSWARESVSDEYHCGGEYGDGSVSSKDFGKTVFLTREEAEKALQQMEGENGIENSKSYQKKDEPDGALRQ